MTTLSNQKVLLLIGETGVGKSSFINAVCGFAKNSSFENAECRGYNLVIPARFLASNGNLGVKSITTGECANEVQEAGMSATKLSCTYNVQFIGQQFYLIDTPGMGDTNGLQQDDVNFQNILTSISSFEEIHAICIFIKQGDTRLHLFFKYCVQKILSNLPRSSVANICVVVTHGHGSNFDVENSLSMLKSYLLQEYTDLSHRLGNHNVFCVDNQFIKYLCTHKDINYEYQVRTRAEESWEHSQQEVARLLQYVSKLPPFDTKTLTHLKNARQLCTMLSKPLADIMSCIIGNIERNSKSIQAMENLSDDTSELESFLNQHHTIQRVIVSDGKPWYTCNQCRESGRQPSDGGGVTYCTSVLPIDLGTLEYSAFKCLQTVYPIVPFVVTRFGVPSHLLEITCRDCGCPAFRHEASCTKVVDEQIQISNPGVREMLANNYSEKEVLAANQETILEETNKLKAELKVIVEAKATLALYLEQIAVSSRDEFLERLEDQAEHATTAPSPNSEHVTFYRSVRMDYLQAKNKLKESCVLIGASTIRNIQETLVALPNYGGTISQILSASEL